jgi:SEC-C motif-containing protein
MNCPCGSGTIYENCCEPFIKGTKLPETAEKLMRSRYSAFVKAEIEYLKKTLAPESRSDFDIAATKKWAEQAQWKGLKIMSTSGGGPEDSKGIVEFVATYVIEGEGVDHHEVSKFRKTDSGQWYFVEGESHTHAEGEGHHHHQKPQTVQREAPKIGRNDPCTCGSGKKYKKCCGSDAAA